MEKNNPKENFIGNTNLGTPKGNNPFPYDFILGTATSAFQIEGEGKTEWQGFIGKDGTPLGKAIMHYERFREDLQYILYLGNAYRFGMDWSKLQEKPFGELDRDALAHYEYIFKTLKENNKKVMLVLNHFSNPAWIFKYGGWPSAKTVDLFVDYSKKVLDYFYPYIDYINTFNEPNAYGLETYLLKDFPPKKFSIIGWKRTLKNMSSAHESIYDYVKEKHPLIQVGISYAAMLIEPFSKKSLIQKSMQVFAGLIQNEKVHELFTKKGKVDFIGFSYYTRILLTGGVTMAYEEKGRKFLEEHGLAHDDLWEIYPEGIYKNLKYFYEKYKKPLIITENGSCTDDDSLRKKVLHDHLRYVLKAINEGIPVKGYFHWSTFDNFELATGPSRRFGLVSIDFKDPKLERKIKDSGEYYHNIVTSKSLLEINTKKDIS
jgi:beta-glucosidase